MLLILKRAQTAIINQLNQTVKYAQPAPITELTNLICCTLLH